MMLDAVLTAVGSFLGILLAFALISAAHHLINLHERRTATRVDRRRRTYQALNPEEEQ